MYLGISNDRLLHMRGVAEHMYNLSKELFSYTEEQARAMYVLGSVHGIGYRFSEVQTAHENIGGYMLKSSGFDYWKEVFHHADPDVSYMSDELLLLNIADMQVSSKGELVGFKARLSDIADRYGEQSQQYLSALKVVGRISEELEARNLPFKNCY